MVAHGYVVLAAAVVEIGLTKAPVATQGVEPLAVDIEGRPRVKLFVAHLTYASLVVHLAEQGAALGVEQLVACIIEVGLTIAVGPPETQLLVAQLSVGLGLEKEFGPFHRLERQLFLKADLTDMSNDLHLAERLFFVGNAHGRGQCGEGVGQVECGRNDWVIDTHTAIPCQIDIVPDTHFAAWQTGNPVPADGGMEGRVVASQYATVEVGIEGGLLLHGTEVCILDDAYLQQVVAWLELLGDIEASTDKGAVDTAQLFTVEHDFGLPVDTIEMEVGML